MEIEDSGGFYTWWLLGVMVWWGCLHSRPSFGAAGSVILRDKREALKGEGWMGRRVGRRDVKVRGYVTGEKRREGERMRDWGEDWGEETLR